MHFNDLVAKCSQAANSFLSQATISLQSSIANRTYSKTILHSDLEKDSIIPITDTLQPKPVTISSFISLIFTGAKGLVKRILFSNLIFKTTPKKSTSKKSRLHSSLSFAFVFANIMKKT